MPRLRVALAVLWTAVPALAGAEAAPLQIATRREGEAGGWEALVRDGLRQGTFRQRRLDPDPLVPGRVHARYTQLVDGTPVEGGEVVVQRDGARAVSVFGSVYDGVDAPPPVRLTPDQARDAVERAAGVDLGPLREPRLMVVPLPGGTFRRAWAVRALAGGDLVLFFVDAATGEVVHRRSILQRQAAQVGIGTGVLGDQKKMSTRNQAPGYGASDALRPPALVTFDMKGNVNRTVDFINGVVGLGPSDVAADADNVWTDGAVVDAHAYAGWTYDYYFRRFGRRGLDGQDLRILSLVHPVRREDAGRYSAPLVNLFYLNAAYFGDGVMMYGEGLDTPVRGLTFDYFSAALDIVAHELTHGVTDYTSALVYEGESGALNEAFSDMMAVGVEFFFQEPGDGPQHADYLLGEDAIRPGGARSMSDPAAYGDPDHYSLRFTGAADNGGVHINSAIPNQAYYLAVEGGRNRTSGLAVQGVGRASREQIETVAYRAFTHLLPPRATFATARQAMLQAAVDLYGAGSAPERALAQAWTAVGVE